MLEKSGYTNLEYRYLVCPTIVQCYIAKHPEASLAKYSHAQLKYLKGAVTARKKACKELLAQTTSC